MAATVHAGLVLAAFIVSPTRAVMLPPLVPASFAVTVRTMNASASNAVAQAFGCNVLASAVSTSSKALQDAAAAAGVIEVAIAAMWRFPNVKEVQVGCSHAVANTILFNRENGLRAGKLGGLNCTLAAYSKWMDDPVITSLGGNVGSYLDFCNENRAILRELGGVHLLIQNIKNNFHGQYSDWNYEPVLNSLFGLSSGCWKSEDQCFEEGFVELAIRLMDEHAGDQKIAEEALQAVKALLYHSPKEYRRAFAEAGLANVLVKVLRESPTDRGAVSLACAATAIFVGPTLMYDPLGTSSFMPFSPQVQALASEAGIVEQLLATVTSNAQLTHIGHPFNFDVDASYNAEADCLQALGSMAVGSSANQEAMMKGGLVEHLSSKLQRGDLNPSVKLQACLVMGALTSNGRTMLATVDKTIQGACSPW